MPDQLADDIRTLRAANMRAIAKQYREMVSALRVIHTWAAVDRDKFKIEWLIPEDVYKLADKVLRRFK